MRVPKAGGTPSVAVATAEPTELLVDTQKQTLYWWNGVDHNLLSAPTAGGTPTVLFQFPGWFLSPFALRQNTQSVYFATYDQSVSDYVFIEVPKNGAPWRLFHSFGCASEYAVDDTAIYFVCGQAAFAGPYLLSFSLTVPMVQPTLLWVMVKNLQVTGLPMVVDGTDIFLIDDGVAKLHPCLNFSEKVLIDLTPKLLATDTNYVYWSEGTMIGRVAK
jgi:hypothetical protein